jgi:hypothetical protein
MNVMTILSDSNPHNRSHLLGFLAGLTIEDKAKVNAALDDRVVGIATKQLLRRNNAKISEAVK